MKKATSDYSHYFKNAWCPLFGELPSCYPIPSTPQYQFTEIIMAARALWGAEPLLCHSVKPYPEPSGIEYSKTRIDTARTIARAHMSIMQNALIMFPDRDWYEKSDGTGALRETLASVWRRAVIVARGSHSFGFIDRTIPDHCFLAVMAISEAWRGLRDILHHGEPENEPGVLQKLNVARALLARGNDMCLEGVIGGLEAEKEQRKRKLSESGSTGGKHEKKRLGIVAAIEELLPNTRSDTSANAKARHLWRRFKRDHLQDTPYKPATGHAVYFEPDIASDYEFSGRLSDGTSTKPIQFGTFMRYVRNTLQRK